MIHDALVIGGGPAGATTALRLAQAGWSVALIEKAVFPRRKVCGEFLSATSLPLLAKIGIDTQFMRQAGPEIRRVAVYAGELSVCAPMPAAAAPWRWGRALGREHLDSLILQRAQQQGVRIWQPWKALALQPLSDRVCCAIEHGDSGERRLLHARIAIAAQGSWESGTLPGLSPRATASPQDLFGFKAHFTDTQLSADTMPLLAFPGGYGGMVHTDGDRVSLSCCIRRDTLQQCRQRFPGAGAGEAVFEHIKSHCRGVHESLDRARVEYKWLAVGPIRPGLRPLHRERTFLVGNAGGEAHPVIAEGLSLALQGAWLLAETLLAHGDAVLRGDPGITGRCYEQMWHRMFAGRIHRASLIAALAMRPSAARILMPVFRGCPALLSACTRLSGKTRMFPELQAAPEC